MHCPSWLVCEQCQIALNLSFLFGTCMNGGKIAKFVCNIGLEGGFIDIIWKIIVRSYLLGCWKVWPGGSIVWFFLSQMFK